MKTIAYKIKTHLVEYLGVPIGPALILIAIFYPIPDMKIGTLWLHLPPGVANLILGVVGIFACYLTIASLLEKNAANSQGASIVLDETKMTFTIVKAFRGQLMTVNYDAIEKVTYTHILPSKDTLEEKMIEISMPSLKPKTFVFDLIHMATDSDFELLLSTLKGKAQRAIFENKKE